MKQFENIYILSNEMIEAKSQIIIEIRDFFGIMRDLKDDYDQKIKDAKDDYCQNIKKLIKLYEENKIPEILERAKEQLKKGNKTEAKKLVLLKKRIIESIKEANYIIKVIEQNI